MWLARNKSGTLHAYLEIPERLDYFPYIGCWSFHERIILKDKCFPEITWETGPIWIRTVHPSWVDPNYFKGVDSL